MRKKKQAIGLGLAFCMGVIPMQALAASPEFAYTQEKWETLRDDKLEFGEIAELVHEYNTTVQQNALDYKDYRGKSSYDIADDYYDAADDLQSMIDYPEDGDAAYAGKLMSALNSEVQAETFTELGDNNVDDGEIVRLGYISAEDRIVKQAQELMISYWSQTESIPTYENSISLAKQSLSEVETRYAAGLVTRSEVDSAKKSVADAEAALVSAKSQLAETRGSLILMLGWDHDAEVEICELPEPDLEAVDAIDLDADIMKAQEMNYDLRITERRIENAKKDTVRKKQQASYENQKSAVAESVKNAYSDLVLAKADYEQAVESRNLAETSLNSSRLRMDAGLITKKAYEQQVASWQSAQIAAETAKMSFLKAQIAYDWAVSGLAQSA